MNWQTINFDWNQVRAFLATVEEGSLSSAARALGLTQPTLGRQVTALEEQLGVTLFERAGRKFVLTASGLELVDHVRAMGEAATRLSLAASGQATSIEGLVKITATEMQSAYVLPELIATLRETHPGITIEIVATNSLSDLRRRDADIAIRNTEPTDPDLIARRLRDQSAGFYATPDFVARHGPFRTLKDLADAPMIGFGEDGGFLEELLRRGVPVSEANIVVRSASHIVHWQLTRCGIGLGINGWDIGDRADDLVRVLDNVLSFDFPVWLVAPRELKTSRRVRIVFDFLAEALSHAP